MIKLFYNYNIFNINLGDLLYTTNIDNYYSIDFFKKGQHFNKFRGFFFNLKCITLLEIDNFLLFYNASYIMLNNLVFKKKVIFFFSFFINESLIYLLFSIITLEELYFLFSNQIFSFISIFKLLKNFNKLVLYQIIKLYVFFFNKKRLFNFNNFIELKRFLFQSISYYDNTKFLYAYFISVLDVELLSLKLYNNLVYDAYLNSIFETYIYKFMSFHELIILKLKNLMENMYKLFDYSLNNIYTLNFLKNYFNFLNDRKFKNNYFLFNNKNFYYKFFFFFHEINLIFKIFWILILKISFYLKKKKIYNNLIIFKFLLWKLKLNLFSFLNFYRVNVFINKNDLKFFQMYIIIIYNFFRKLLLVNYFFLSNFKFFKFLNYFLIKFINFIFYKKISLNFDFSSILYNYSDFFLLNFSKYFNYININDVSDIFNFKNFKIKKQKKIIFFKNQNINLQFKKNLFFFFINFKIFLYILNIRFFFFSNLTNRTLFLYGFNINKVSLNKPNYIDSFSKFYNYYPYYIILKNFFSFSKLYLYLPLSYRVISKMEEFFFLLTEDYIVEGFEGFYFDMNYNFYNNFYINWDEENEDSEDLGNEYFMNTDSSLIYQEQFFLFDIYNELKSFNSYIYFFFRKKYNFIYTSLYNNNTSTFLLPIFKNNTSENNNIYYDYFFLKTSPFHNTRNDYVYKDYITHDAFSWFYWSFYLFENDLETYIDTRAFNYKEVIPLFLKKKKISSYLFEKDLVLENIKNTDNFLDFSIFSKNNSQLNFESTVYLTNSTLFSYFLLFLKISIFRPIGFLTEKWWWWNILKYDFKNYFSIDFLYTYLFPKNNEESIFLFFFYNLGLISKIKNRTHPIDFRKLELFYDTFIYDYFNSINNNIININDSFNFFFLYENYIKKYVELIFYFDYIELLNFVYEFSYYLDISYYKIFFFLNKVEKLLDFFINQTFLNLFYNYYEPLAKKDRMFFFELLFLNIFSMFYKYFQFELEYENDNALNKIDYERSKYFLEIMDDMYLPSFDQFERSQSFYNFINLKSIELTKDKDLKELDLNYFSVYYLNFLNDPYFLFSNKFNVSFSFPELVLADLYENYSLYFYNLEDEENLEFSLLKTYKFFDFDTKDSFFDMSTSEHVRFLSVFDSLLFSEGFFYDNSYLFFLEMSFSNYFIGESYNNYLNRLESLHKYNLTLTSNLYNYLESTRFFFSDLILIASHKKNIDYFDQIFFKDNNIIFFFKNLLLFEKLYFYYLVIFSLNRFLNRSKYINFFSYLFFLLFYSVLVFIKKLSLNLLNLKIYLLFIIPFYLIFLLFKVVKKKFNLNIFSDKNILLTFSLENLVIIVLLIYKEIKLFIYFFFFIYNSFNNLYFFFFKYNFLFKNLFNLNLFKFCIKFFKFLLNLKVTNSKSLNKKLLDLVYLEGYFYKQDFVSFRSFSSLKNLYKYDFNGNFLLFDNVYSIFNWLNNGNLKNLENNFYNFNYLKKNDYKFINKKIFSNLIFFNNFFFLDTVHVSDLDLQLNQMFSTVLKDKEIYYDNFLDNLDTSLTDLDNYNDNIFNENNDKRSNFDSLSNFKSRIYDEWSSEFVVGDISDEYDTDETSIDMMNNVGSVINEEFNYELSTHNFFNYVDINFNDVFVTEGKKNDTYFFKNYLRGYNLIKKYDNISLYYFMLVKKFILFILPYYKKYDYINYFNIYYYNYNSYLNVNSNRFEKKQLKTLLNKKKLNLSDQYNYLNLDSSLYYFLDNNFVNFSKLFQIKENLDKLFLDKEIYYSLNYMYTYELHENLDFFLDGLDDREDAVYLSSFLENKYNSKIFIKLSNFNKMQKKKINLSLILLFFFYLNITTYKFFFFKINFFELIEIFFFSVILNFNFFNLSFLFFKFIYLKVYLFFYEKLNKFFLFRKQINLSNNLLKNQVYFDFFFNFYNLKLNLKNKNMYIDLINFLLSNYLYILDGFSLKVIFLLKTFYKNSLSIFTYFLFVKYIFWLIFIFKYLNISFNKLFFYLKIQKMFFLLKNYETFLFFNVYKLYKIYLLYSVNEVFYYINNIYILNSYKSHVSLKENFYLKYIFYFEFFFFILNVFIFFFIYFFFYYYYSTVLSFNIAYINSNYAEIEYMINRYTFYGIDIFHQNYFRAFLTLYYSSLIDSFWMMF